MVNWKTHQAPDGISVSSQLSWATHENKSTSHENKKATGFIYLEM